ncbi:hypothetical protein BT96DRAFT_567278 [Gymnopus androsaceus JB14]|uniref:Uncharacterized protein n=1 Tax=Gymnopus androsaceus JB14 TaxID=1447944 RepID=A0A6A4GJT3_9AGAR|nr:hypothetical protein BT96DRAFT_567278 [Gymnopus androsaceus JB14]
MTMTPSLVRESDSTSILTPSSVLQQRQKAPDTYGSDGKKKKGVFRGFFSRKKDKDKKDKNGSRSPFEVFDNSRPSRTPENSGRSSGTDLMTVSTTQTAMQQQPQGKSRNLLTGSVAILPFQLFSKVLTLDILWDQVRLYTY